jgi:hypothetical protein
MRRLRKGDDEAGAQPGEPVGREVDGSVADMPESEVRAPN